MYCPIVMRTDIQATYPTGSKGLRKLALELRRRFQRVFVSSLGPSVTDDGLRILTMVTVYHEGDPDAALGIFRDYAPIPA